MWKTLNEENARKNVRLRTQTFWIELSFLRLIIFLSIITWLEASPVTRQTGQHHDYINPPTSALKRGSKVKFSIVMHSFFH